VEAKPLLHGLLRGAAATTGDRRSPLHMKNPGHLSVNRGLVIVLLGVRESAGINRLVSVGGVGFKHLPQGFSGFPGFFRSRRGHREPDLQGCRGAEETGELTREVPLGKDFPEYPCPVPTHP